MSSYKLSESIDTHVIPWLVAGAVYATCSAVVALLNFIRAALPMVWPSLCAVWPTVLNVCTVLGYIGGFAVAVVAVCVAVLWLCANPHVVLCVAALAVFGWATYPRKAVKA